MGRRLQRNVGTPSIAVLFVMAMACLGPWCCSGGGERQAETVVVGVSTPLEANTLLYLAEERNFFTHNGLRVKIRTYDTGMAALDAMVKGDVDIAVPSEFGVARHVLQKRDIRILACWDKVQIAALIARKDRGIKALADLRGRRISLPRHTNAEFYLGRFLDLHRMSTADVRLEDAGLTRLQDAIVAGATDAVVLWEPYRSHVEKRLGMGASVWPIQCGQPAFCVAACGSQWLSAHAGAVIRFLGGLAEAEEYLDRHEGEVKTLIMRRLGYDREYMELIWPRQQFALSLDQSLITAMEDEARWMIATGMIAGKETPDFLNHVYMDGLKSVKPGATTIIR
jgi:ABC-type nitrate/sulfonate/bicarbonate transport system substrate-binding protein